MVHFVTLFVALGLMVLDCVQSVRGRTKFTERNAVINWLVSKMGLPGVALYFVTYAALVTLLTVLLRNNLLYALVIPVPTIIGETVAVISNARLGIDL